MSPNECYLCLRSVQRSKKGNQPAGLPPAPKHPRRARQTHRLVLARHPNRSHSSRDEQQPLPNTIAIPHLIVTANHRPSLVYRAQHGVPVQSCAPAVVKTRHDPSAPPVLFRQFGRNVVVAHQHHLQPAAAGFARAARDGRAIARIVGMVFCWHPQITPLSFSSLLR